MIDRRTFLAGTGAVLLAVPIAAEAQQTGKVYRIGYLLSPPARLLASFESLIGIYFLSIIIAGYLSLSKGGRTA